MGKLDRFLISTDWDDLLSPVIVSALPRPRSDHMPKYVASAPKFC